MTPSPIDLLLLDYGGVCTPTHQEYLRASGPLDEVRPECRAVVAAASRAGVTVAILSNELPPDAGSHGGFLGDVDHVISCADSRISKPDRRAFERALLVTGCAADRTLFVDDEADNVNGAIGAGIPTLLFDRSDPANMWSEIATRAGVGMS